VPNPDGKLKPGMTATVRIEIARADGVLMVPNAALRFQPGDGGSRSSAPRPRPVSPAEDAATGHEGGRVWTVRDGQLRPVRVETGISNGTATAVLDGDLSEDMSIVTGLVASNTTATASTASPLIPQRMRGNRQGGGGAAQGGRR
jgi:HlyD family secretion protein